MANSLTVDEFKSFNHKPLLIKGHFPFIRMQLLAVNSDPRADMQRSKSAETIVRPQQDNGGRVPFPGGNMMLINTTNGRSVGVVGRILHGTIGYPRAASPFSGGKSDVLVAVADSFLRATISEQRSAMQLPKPVK